MKLGFVFPGQGSQFVGMGKDYYEKYECVRKVYNKASQILGFDIAKLSFEGPEEELNQTKNTQLAILVMSLAISELLKQNNIEANISAGLDDNTIEEVCKKVTSGFVVPANYNCQGQVAISGEKQAVEEAMDLLKQAGAKRAIELKTSGPFHTEKLQEASKKLYEALQEIQINKISDKKVIKNIDAIEYTDADNIKQILANHVINPVKFKESIENMISQGVDTIIEIGPGKVLSGFVKKTNKEIKIYNTNNIEAFEQILDDNLKK